MSAHLTARASRRSLGIILQHAGRQALQFRLMLLWLVGMAIPTLLFALPILTFLGAELDYSPAAPALASSFAVGSLIDLLDAPDFSFSLLYAVLLPSVFVMLVIAPWLSALALGAARIPGPARFRVLIDAANAAYWPMVRLALLGVVPLMLALLLAKMAADAVSRYDEHAILESSVDHLLLASRVFGVLLVALSQCTLEVARAVLVAHPRRRSVLRAWWTGLAFLYRHPLYLFGTWLLITMPLQLLVGLIIVLRINLDQGSVIGLLLALLLAEACVLILAWMRCMRLFSLVDLVTRFTSGR